MASSRLTSYQTRYCVIPPKLRTFCMLRKQLHDELRRPLHLQAQSVGDRRRQRRRRGRGKLPEPLVGPPLLLTARLWQRPAPELGSAEIRSLHSRNDLCSQFCSLPCGVCAAPPCTARKASYSSDTGLTPERLFKCIAIRRGKFLCLAMLYRQEGQRT